MQESRKIALTSLLDNKICGYASCVLDLENYIRPNVALVAAHRKGDRYAKKRLKGIVCGTPLENCSLRNDQNFAPWGRGALRFLDFDKMPFATTPTQFVNSFFAKFAHIDGFEDCCVAEVSASGGCHIFAPALSDDAKADMLFYQQFADSPVDLSCSNASRVALLSGEVICLTSYRPLFTPVDDHIVAELIAMRDALEGTQPESLVQEAVKIPCAPVSSVVKIESSDLDVYREIINELLGGQMPKRGTRNQTLYRHTVELMSLGLSDYEQLCEVFECFGWYGLSPKEGKACVSSALKKQGAERSNECREAVSAVLEKRPHTTIQLSAETSVVVPVNETEACHIVSPSESETETAATAAGWTPWGVLPAMPAKLPSFVRLLVSPIRAQHTWAHALTLSESALATYLKNVTFTELTGLSKPLYNGWFTVSLAPSSSGKSVASMCIKAITQKLDEEDRRVREMMEDWLAEERTRKSSDGVRKPLNSSRLCGSDTTSSGLFQRFKELDPGTALYISTPELMSLKNVASGDYVKFFLMAHDAEEYSVERSTSTGESGRATLSLNVSAMAPIGIGQEFFAGHTEDGLVSRFIFSTIEENKNWDDLEPLYDTSKLKNYADGFEKYIQRLEAAEGKHFAKREIEDFCKSLQAEIFQMAAEYNSESLRILSRRAIIHLQKMCYLYMILEGRWTSDLQDFMLWRWRYMLGAMYRVMGKNIESEISKSTSLLNACKSQSGPVSILASMPEHFSLHEFMARRKSLNFADQTESAAKAQLRTLKHRRLIEQDDTGYINLKKKKS